MLELATEKLQKEICERFNTSHKQLQQDVQILRDWIKTQPHLPQCANDTMLMTYLISCKNSLERAKEKIDNYYTARTDMPEFFEDRDPLDRRIQESAREARFFPLPKLSPDGYRVVMFSFVTGDPKKLDLVAFFKHLLSTEDIKMNREVFVTGSYYVFDVKPYSLSHLLKLTPQLARNIIHCAQDVLPLRIKGLIFINSPTFIELAINVMKPFMKGKLLQKIHIHTEGPEVLEQYFPKSMLPRDYGGEEDTSDNLNEAWLKCIEEERSWFLHEGSLKSDEGKRDQTKKNLQELHGSFRTLCVD